ncbi:5'-Nucleotidase domain protein [Ignavibacterium album JCM 16511]|uniref:5'-Nucleotidase domain protein n=1 Tax=Ignavibacterium album (strain DSM 19864 / JCM 16511 / NBRC 101810 / Mat9-16) TaxID=945713 RepID=I0AJ66_IGNAJ|nr:T9SS type A sorting domain-containing protein [Ignavibacterium album]AFH49023.1 5'-Nucleotidase domain protein [Ignavibacterium album JCM 16511]
MKTLSVLSVIIILSISSVNAQWIQVDDSNLGGDIMALLEYDNVLYAGGTAYLFRSSDQGNSWSGNFGPLAFAWTLTKSEGKIYCGIRYPNTGIFKSTNNGLDWQSTSFTFEPMSLASGDTFIVTSGFGNPHIYLSSDEGQTWNSISNHIGYLAVSRNRIYAALSGLKMTSDFGINWSNIHNDPGISVVAEDSIIFFGTQNGKIYRSTNYGQSWETKFDKPGAYVFSLYKYGEYIFAGTDSGFYVSTNNGESFFSKNDNLGSSRVNAILVYNNYVFVGNGNYSAVPVSVWKRPLSEILGVNQQKENGPNSFLLYQNYPNPFNPTTKIQYELSSKQFVKLKIYDLLGDEVATLVNEEKPAGIYEVEFNVSQYSSSDITSGVYFYRMETSSPVGQTSSKTKKMILMK